MTLEKAPNHVQSTHVHDPCLLHLALLHSNHCTVTHKNPNLILHVIILGVSEKLLTKEDPSLYHHINQGCLDVDGMDDKEEMQIADVCTHPNLCDSCLLLNIDLKKFSIFWKNLANSFVKNLIQFLCSYGNGECFELSPFVPYFSGTTMTTN